MSTVEAASTPKKKSKKTDMENESAENQENASVKAGGKTVKDAKSKTKSKASGSKTPKASKSSKSKAANAPESGIVETAEIIISGGSPTITVSPEVSSEKPEKTEEVAKFPGKEQNEKPETEADKIHENEMNENPGNEIQEKEMNENPEEEQNENPEQGNLDGNDHQGQSGFGEQPMNQTQIPMQVHSNIVQANGIIQAPHLSQEQIQEAMKKAKSQEIRIHISKSENFKQAYAIGALGVHNIYDFRMSFYNDTPDLPTDPTIRNIRRVIESEIIMSPVAAMELYRWLGQSLAEYEARFGKIKKLQEIPLMAPAQNMNQMPAAIPGDSGDSHENNNDAENKRRHDFMDGYA